MILIQLSSLAGGGRSLTPLVTMPKGSDGT